jgi:uncharacterized membrane protein YheB (UPF0754 family)
MKKKWDFKEGDIVVVYKKWDRKLAKEADNYHLYFNEYHFNMLLDQNLTVHKADYGDSTLHVENENGDLVWAPMSIFCKQEELSSETKEKKMNNILGNVLNNNKEALKTAAELKAAKTAMAVMKKSAKKYLPDNLAAFADTPIGTLVIANVLNQAIPHLTDNSLAVEMADAALTSAYQELLDSLHLDQFVEDFIKGVTKK